MPIFSPADDVLRAIELFAACHAIDDADAAAAIDAISIA